MRLTFDLTGQDEMARAFQSVAVTFKKRVLLQALEVAGLPILKRMEQLAPFDPESTEPHLKHNLGMMPLRSWDGQRGHDEEAAIAIGPAKFLRHGGFQEFGTADTLPQPYMRPAWDEQGGQTAQRRVADELWIAVKAAV